MAEDSWRSHPVVVDWLRQCKQAGRCRPSDVELLRKTLQLPKYKMHDLLEGAIRPVLNGEGIEYTESGGFEIHEYTEPVVRSLPAMDDPLELPSMVRQSSSEKPVERFAVRMTGATADNCPERTQKGGARGSRAWLVMAIFAVAFILPPLLWVLYALQTGDSGLVLCGVPVLLLALLFVFVNLRNAIRPSEVSPRFKERVERLEQGRRESLEAAARRNDAVYAARSRQDAAKVCPHCQSKGSVHTHSITVKNGIDGRKATAAVVTGGWSVLATGLSKKDRQTEAHCSKCGATWRF